jgi:hypothetical protein
MGKQMTRTDETPTTAVENHDVLYREETCGRLLRQLNALCVKALRSGNHEEAKRAAELSAAVEAAMRYADDQPLAGTASSATPVERLVILHCDNRDHERFRGVFGTRNGCLACELETTAAACREAHRLLGKVIPENQNDMIRWAVRSGDSVYTNAGAAFRVLCDVVGGELMIEGLYTFTDDGQLVPLPQNGPGHALVIQDGGGVEFEAVAETALDTDDCSTSV